jgi:hypothetical protein
MSSVRFLEVPALRHMANLLSHLDCGDQRLDARIELYVQESTGLSGSPGSARQSPAPKDIHSTMVYILNDAFPEYQFNRLSRENFTQRTDTGSVVNSVNQTLGCVVERSHPGLLDELWQVLRQTIDLSTTNSDIYELVNDALDESRLWSFYLFWHDKSSSKVLLFSCRAKSKLFHHSSSSESGFDSRSSKWSVSSRDDLMASSSDCMSDHDLSY